MTVDVDALRGFVAWKDSFDGSPTAWDFLGQVGGPTLAAAFATLFWPAFVEARGCVLLRERYDPAAFDAWWQELGGDKARIEAAVNHVHLWDVFPQDGDEIDEDVLRQLAEVIAAGWRAAVSAAYPDQEFRVAVADDYGPTLTLASGGG